MYRIGPAFIAVTSVILATASAVVTNLLTDRWSWTTLAFLLALTAASAALAWMDRRQSRARTATTTVSVRAERKGRIEGSRIDASSGAEVNQTARKGGKITRSGVKSVGAASEQVAGDGEIVDSPQNLR
jgi:hypothetical protein